MTRALLHPTLVASAIAVTAAPALADLAGTPIDVNVSHSGLYGFEADVTHTYGTTTVIADPNFEAFSFDLVTPGGVTGLDNSMALDFTNFAYGDFSGETGSLTLDALAEVVDGASVALLDEGGLPVGVVSGSGNTIIATWSVDDVLAAGTGTMLFLAWDSEPVDPGIVLQPKMGEPMLGLTPDQLARFAQGRIDYNAPLLVEDGLGPTFNKENCGNCHNNPLGGTGSQTVTRFAANDPKGAGFDDLSIFGGSLLQSQTIDPFEICKEVVPAEATLEKLRVTIGSMGYGLIEAIDDANIIFLADNPPAAGISGRARRVFPVETPAVERVGRFGWKAQVATILTFSADASLNEMGLTNRFFPEESDPNGIRAPLPSDCDDVPDPEDGPDAMGLHFIDRVTDFQHFMTEPPQTPRSGMTGEVVFNTVGCNQCHVAEFTTRDDESLEDAIRNKTIRPYSDFLLHDVGLAADFIQDGDPADPDHFASDQEIRTPVLWGVRTRDPLWHDASIGGDTFENRMDAVIQQHGLLQSEAVGVVASYDSLSPADKAFLYQFLDSLGKIEFDADGDNDVELDDFLAFAACYHGPQGYSADDACAVSDIDQDLNVDLDDFEFFLQAFEGTLDDCDASGEIDLREILLDPSLDLDNDGQLDVCDSPPCPGDIDGNGEVAFEDLLEVLSNWGPCQGCPADIDGSGEVDFADLLEVLAGWGPCV